MKKVQIQKVYPKILKKNLKKIRIKKIKMAQNIKRKKITIAIVAIMKLQENHIDTNGLNK